MEFSYREIPKTWSENLVYRRRVAEWSRQAPRNGAALWSKCADAPGGLLFWINTFAWLHEPRREDKVKVIPFISYPYQDEGMLKMLECFGRRDLCIVKSRDMGVTWMLCMVFLWRFIFRPMESLLLVSRRADIVDARKNSDSLFWKLDFQLERQPSFLRPRWEHTEMELVNLGNGSLINGEATTGNIGKGGRRGAIGLDEFAAFPLLAGYEADTATQAVTHSRFFNATPEGMNNAYADRAHDEKIEKLRFHWSLHPEKRRGLYTTEGNSLKILDEEYEFGPDYPFILDGKKRSPWYDFECGRAINSRQIAQELDMDFHGSSYAFFGKDVMDEHERLYCRPHVHRGELNYNTSTGEIVDAETGDGIAMVNGTKGGFVEDQDKGNLMLWCHLMTDGRPTQEHEYVIGVDVSAGAGASNSVANVQDVQTGEQVAEYACPTISPSDLGVFVAALGRWFGGREGRFPTVIAESNGGHNRQFHKSLLNVGYGSLYYRRNEQDTKHKISTVPGWGSTKDNKRELLEEFSRALAAGDILIRSRFCLDESRLYVYSSDGSSVEFAGTGSGVDPSGAKNNHGDRTMAAALGLHAMHIKTRAPKPKEIIPVGCLQWRMDKRQERAAKREDVLVGW